MKTQLWAVALVFCGTFIGSWGGLLLKMAVDEISLSFWNIIRSRKIIAGITLFVLSSFLYIWALKGGELSMLYPMLSLSYLWIAVLSHVFLKEKIGGWKIIGLFFIVLGIVLVGIA
jgi:drug/metabolite transporter (DMT)-like permease